MLTLYNVENVRALKFKSSCFFFYFVSWNKCKANYYITRRNLSCMYRVGAEMPEINYKPGSWQTSLGLGSMFRYSAQMSICITINPVNVTFVIGQICERQTIHWSTLTKRLIEQHWGHFTEWRISHGKRRLWKNAYFYRLTITRTSDDQANKAEISTWYSIICNYLPLICMNS